MDASLMEGTLGHYFKFGDFAETKKVWAIGVPHRKVEDFLWDYDSISHLSV